jgi:hypothetical protein
MTRAELTSHPLTPSQAVWSIVSTTHRRADSVHLAFVVTGQITQIKLPETQEPARTDELWQHTCFEVFARSPGANAYMEFNFSPSTQWAAYRFGAYREGMMPMELHSAPIVHVAASETRLQFDVQMDARDFPAPVELALTAVIEELSGAKSYWAIEHRANKPDFHHEHGFVLTLN